MNQNEVQDHSLKAFNKWKADWEHNSTANKPRIRTSLKELLNKYKGKKAFLFAYGPSFKQNVADLKANGLDKDPNVVIGCVDKAFRPLVELGIQPDFCLVADGQIKMKWIEGVDPESIKNCFLISNIYASPGYSELWEKHSAANNIYWYLNKDNLQVTPNNKCGTADYFGKYADFYEVIPAASNVGNSLVVISHQILGIRDINLCAFDYCWKDDLYYGTVDDEKKNYIGHMRVVADDGILAWVSTNMDFSARWLEKYIQVKSGLDRSVFYDCSNGSVLRNIRRKSLEKSKVYWRNSTDDRWNEQEEAQLISR